MKQRTLALLLVLVLLTIPGVASATTHAAPFDVKFSGLIQAVPAAGGTTWVIAGMTVKTTAATQVKLEGVTQAKAGMWADVTAQRADAAGTYTASKIVVRAAPVLTPEVEDDEVTVYGPIQAFSDNSWTIAGTKLAVTKDTKITGTPQIGLLARAEAIKTAAGALQAKSIKVVWVEPKRGLGPAQFRGVIDAMPSGLIGMWTISGRQVEVTAATILQQNKGEAKVGASVHVVTAPPPKAGEVAKATLIQVLGDEKSGGDKDKGKPAGVGKPEDTGNSVTPPGKASDKGKSAGAPDRGKGPKH